MLGIVSRMSLAVIMTGFFTQCQTLPSSIKESGRAPRVEIEAGYRQFVVDACTEVMVENGFRFAASRGDNFVYEKPGSKMDYLAWGNFSSDEEIVERAALQIRSLGADAFEVECQPFIVLRPGEHLEDARKVSRLKHGKYQKMLEAVKKRSQSGELPPPDWDSWD